MASRAGYLTLKTSIQSFIESEKREVGLSSCTDGLTGVVSPLCLNVRVYACVPYSRRFDVDVSPGSFFIAYFPSVGYIKKIKNRDMSRINNVMIKIP
jgi:hypothetical protein